MAHIRRFETANPELAGELAEEMKAPNRRRAPRARCSAFAKSRMSAEDWSKVAKAVSGMDRLLEAAPAAPTGTAGAAASAAAGAMDTSAGDIAGAAAAFPNWG